MDKTICSWSVGEKISKFALKEKFISTKLTRRKITYDDLYDCIISWEKREYLKKKVLGFGWRDRRRWKKRVRYFGDLRVAVGVSEHSKKVKEGILWIPIIIFFEKFFPECKTFFDRRVVVKIVKYVNDKAPKKSGYDKMKVDNVLCMTTSFRKIMTYLLILEKIIGIGPKERVDSAILFAKIRLYLEKNNLATIEYPNILDYVKHDFAKKEIFVALERLIEHRKKVALTHTVRHDPTATEGSGFFNTISSWVRGGKKTEVKIDFDVLLEQKKVMDRMRVFDQLENKYHFSVETDRELFLGKRMKLYVQDLKDLFGVIDEKLRVREEREDVITFSLALLQFRHYVLLMPNEESEKVELLKLFYKISEELQFGVLSPRERLIVFYRFFCNQTYRSRRSGSFKKLKRRFLRSIVELESPDVFFKILMIFANINTQHRWDMEDFIEQEIKKSHGGGEPFDLQDMEQVSKKQIFMRSSRCFRLHFMLIGRHSDNNFLADIMRESYRTFDYISFKDQKFEVRKIIGANLMGEQNFRDLIGLSLVPLEDFEACEMRERDLEKLVGVNRYHLIDILASQFFKESESKKNALLEMMKRVDLHSKEILNQHKEGKSVSLFLFLYFRYLNGLCGDAVVVREFRSSIFDRFLLPKYHDFFGLLKEIKHYRLKNIKKVFVNIINKYDKNDMYYVELARLREVHGGLSKLLHLFADFSPFAEIEKFPKLNMVELKVDHIDGLRAKCEHIRKVATWLGSRGLYFKYRFTLQRKMGMVEHLDTEKMKICNIEKNIKTVEDVIELKFNANQDFYRCVCYFIDNKCALFEGIVLKKLLKKRDIDIQTIQVEVGKFVTFVTKIMTKDTAIEISELKEIDKQLLILRKNQDIESDLEVVMNFLTSNSNDYIIDGVGRNELEGKIVRGGLQQKTVREAIEFAKYINYLPDMISVLESNKDTSTEKDDIEKDIRDLSGILTHMKELEKNKELTLNLLKEELGKVQKLLKGVQYFHLQFFSCIRSSSELIKFLRENPDLKISFLRAKHVDQSVDVLLSDLQICMNNIKPFIENRVSIKVLADEVFNEIGSDEEMKTKVVDYIDSTTRNLARLKLIVFTASKLSLKNLLYILSEYVFRNGRFVSFLPLRRDRSPEMYLVYHSVDTKTEKYSAEGLVEIYRSCKQYQEIERRDMNEEEIEQIRKSSACFKKFQILFELAEKFHQLRLDREYGYCVVAREECIYCGSDGSANLDDPEKDKDVVEARKVLARKVAELDLFHTELDNTIKNYPTLAFFRRKQLVKLLMMFDPKVPKTEDIDRAYYYLRSYCQARAHPKSPPKYEELRKIIDDVCADNDKASKFQRIEAILKKLTIWSTEGREEEEGEEEDGNDEDEVARRRKAISLINVGAIQNPGDEDLLCVLHEMNTYEWEYKELNRLPYHWQLFWCNENTTDVDLQEFNKRRKAFPNLTYFYVKVDKLRARFRETLLLDIQKPLKDNKGKPIFIKTYFIFEGEEGMETFMSYMDSSSVNLDTSRPTIKKYIREKSLLQFNKIRYFTGDPLCGKTTRIKRCMKNKRQIRLSVHESFSASLFISRYMDVVGRSDAEEEEEEEEGEVEGDEKKGTSIADHKDEPVDVFLNIFHTAMGGEVQIQKLEKFLYNLVFFGVIVDELTGEIVDISNRTWTNFNLFVEIPNLIEKSVVQLKRGEGVVVSPSGKSERKKRVIPTLKVMGKRTHVRNDEPFIVDSKFKEVCWLLNKYMKRGEGSFKNLHESFKNEKQRIKTNDDEYYRYLFLSFLENDTRFGRKILKIKFHQRCFIELMHRHYKFLTEKIIPEYFLKGRDTMIGYLKGLKNLPDGKKFLDSFYKQNTPHPRTGEVVERFFEGMVYLSLEECSHYTSRASSFDIGGGKSVEKLVPDFLPIHTHTKFQDPEDDMKWKFHWRFDLFKINENAREVDCLRHFNHPKPSENMSITECVVAQFFGADVDRFRYRLRRNYVLTPEILHKLLMLRDRQCSGIPLIFSGMTGCGKTELFRMFAEFMNMREDFVPSGDKWLEIFAENLKVDKIYETLTEEEKGKLASSPQVFKTVLEKLKRMESEDYDRLKKFLILFMRKELDNFPVTLRTEKIKTIESLDLEGKDFKEKLQYSDFIQLFDEFLEAKIDQGFFISQIEMHQGMTASELLMKVKTIRDKCMKRKKKLDKASKTLRDEGRIPKGSPEALFQHVIFIDETNTSTIMGMVKELFVDHTLDGEKLPDYLVFAGCINPFEDEDSDINRKKKKGGKKTDEIVDEETDEFDEKKKEERLKTYLVNEMPPSMRHLVVKFEDVKGDNEKEFVRQYLVLNNRRREDEGKNPLEPRVFLLLNEFILFGQKFIRDQNWKRVKCSIRDIIRACTYFNFFYDSYFTNLETEEKRVYFSITWMMNIAYGFRTSPNTKKGEYTSSRPKFETELVIKLIQRFDDEFNDEDQNGNTTDFQYVRYTVMKDFAKHLRFPSYIAKTRSFLENIFVSFVCIMCRTPLIQCGPPGCSKTLSVRIITENMKGSSSRSKFFKDKTSTEKFVHQCQADTTSTELRHTFERAVAHQVKIDSQSKIKELATVLLDESGLLKEKRHSLKVIHYFLDHPIVCTILLTNSQLDAAKTNRCCLLNQIEPTEEELAILCKTLFGFQNEQEMVDGVEEEENEGEMEEEEEEMECDAFTNAFIKGLCKAFRKVNHVHEMQLVPKELGDGDNDNEEEEEHEGENEDEVMKKIADIDFMMMENKDDDHIPIFHLRDFHYFLRMFKKKCTRKETGSFDIQNMETTTKNMEYALQRNFNGKSKDNMKKIIKLFRMSVQGEIDKEDFRIKLPPTPEDGPQLKSTIELLRESLGDQQEKGADPNMCHYRFVLIVDPTTVQSSVKLLQDVGVLDKTFEVIEVSDFDEDDSNYERSKVISEIKHQLQKENKKILLLNSEKIHTNFYDLFNRYFVTHKNDGLYYANISDGSHRSLCPVHPGVKIVLHVTREGIQKGLIPLPLLNRFEKYEVSFEDVIQYKIEKKAKKMGRQYESIYKTFREIKKSVEVKFVKKFVREDAFYGYQPNLTIDSLLFRALVESEDHQFMIPPPFHPGKDNDNIDLECWKDPSFSLDQVVRQFNFYLLQIARTHSFYIKRNVFLEEYLKEYLMNQHHLSVESFIQEFLEYYFTPKAKYENEKKKARETELRKKRNKWIFFTRSSTETSLFQDYTESAYTRALAAKSGAKLKVCHLSQLETESKCEEVVKKYSALYSKDSKNCSIFVANTSTVSRNQINKLRNLIERFYGKFWDNEYPPIVMIIIHFPPSHVNFPPAYDTIYLNNWNFLYSDIFSESSHGGVISEKAVASRVADKIDPRFWFRAAVGIEKSMSNELIKNDFCGIFSRTKANQNDERPTIIDQVCKRITQFGAKMEGFLGPYLSKKTKELFVLTDEQADQEWYIDSGYARKFLNKFFETYPDLKERILTKFARNWQVILSNKLMETCVEIQEGNVTQGICQVIFEKLQFYMLGIVQHYIKAILRDLNFESILSFLQAGEVQVKLVGMMFSDLEIPSLKEIQANYEVGNIYFTQGFLPFKIPFFHTIQEKMKSILEKVDMGRGIINEELVKKVYFDVDSCEFLKRTHLKIQNEGRLKDMYFEDMICYSLDLFKLLNYDSLDGMERREWYDEKKHNVKLVLRKMMHIILQKHTYSFVELHLFFTCCEVEIRRNALTVLTQIPSNYRRFGKEIEKCKSMEDIMNELLQMSVASVLNEKTFDEMLPSAEDTEVDFDKKLKLEKWVEGVKSLGMRVKSAEIGSLNLRKLENHLDNILILPTVFEFIIRLFDNDDDDGEDNELEMLKKLKGFGKPMPFKDFVTLVRDRFGEDVFNQWKDFAFREFCRATLLYKKKKPERVRMIFDIIRDQKEYITGVHPRIAGSFFRNVIQKTAPTIILDFNNQDRYFAGYYPTVNKVKTGEFSIFNPESMDGLKWVLFETYLHVAKRNMKVMKAEIGLRELCEEYEKMLGQDQKEKDAQDNLLIIPKSNFTRIIKRNVVIHLLLEKMSSEISKSQDLDVLHMLDSFEYSAKVFKNILSDQTTTEAAKTELVLKLFRGIDSKETVYKVLRHEQLLDKLGVKDGWFYDVGVAELPPYSSFPFQTDTNSMYKEFQRLVATHKNDAGNGSQRIVDYMKQKLDNGDEQCLKYEFRMYIILVMYHDFYLKCRPCMIFTGVLQNEEIKRRLNITEEELEVYHWFCRGPPEPPYRISGENLHDLFHSDFVRNEKNLDTLHILVNMIAVTMGSPKDKLHTYTRMFDVQKLVGTGGPGYIGACHNYDCGYQTYVAKIGKVNIGGKMVDELEHRMNLSAHTFDGKQVYHALNNFFTWASLGLSLLFFNPTKTNDNLRILSGNHFLNLLGEDSRHMDTNEKKVIYYIMTRAFTFLHFTELSPTVRDRKLNITFFATQTLYLIWKSLVHDQIFDEEELKFVEDPQHLGRSDAKGVLRSNQEKVKYENFWKNVAMKKAEKSYGKLMKIHEAKNREYGNLDNVKRLLDSFNEENISARRLFGTFQTVYKEVDAKIADEKRLSELQTLLDEKDENGKPLTHEEIGRREVTFTPDVIALSEDRNYVTSFMELAEKEFIAISHIPKLVEFEQFLFRSLGGRISIEKSLSLSLRASLEQIGKGLGTEVEFLQKYEEFKKIYNECGELVLVEGGVCAYAREGAENDNYAEEVLSFIPLTDDKRCELKLDHFVFSEEDGGDDVVRNRLRLLIEAICKRQNALTPPDFSRKVNIYELPKIRNKGEFIIEESPLQEVKDFIMSSVPLSECDQLNDLNLTRFDYKKIRIYVTNEYFRSRANMSIPDSKPVFRYRDEELGKGVEKMKNIEELGFFQQTQNLGKGYRRKEVTTALPKLVNLELVMRYLSSVMEYCLKENPLKAEEEEEEEEEGEEDGQNENISIQDVYPLSEEQNRNDFISTVGKMPLCYLQSICREVMKYFYFSKDRNKFQDFAKVFMRRKLSEKTAGGATTTTTAAAAKHPIANNMEEIIRLNVEKVVLNTKSTDREVLRYQKVLEKLCDILFQKELQDDMEENGDVEIVESLKDLLEKTFPKNDLEVVWEILPPKLRITWYYLHDYLKLIYYYLGITKLRYHFTEKDTEKYSESNEKSRFGSSLRDLVKTSKKKKKKKEDKKREEEDEEEGEEEQEEEMFWNHKYEEDSKMIQERIKLRKIIADEEEDSEEVEEEGEDEPEEGERLEDDDEEYMIFTAKEDEWNDEDIGKYVFDRDRKWKEEMEEMKKKEEGYVGSGEDDFEEEFQSPQVKKDFFVDFSGGEDDEEEEEGEEEEEEKEEEEDVLFKDEPKEVRKTKEPKKEVKKEEKEVKEPFEEMCEKVDDPRRETLGALKTKDLIRLLQRYLPTEIKFKHINKVVKKRTGLIMLLKEDQFEEFLKRCVPQDSEFEDLILKNLKMINSFLMKMKSWDPSVKETANLVEKRKRIADLTEDEKKKINAFELVVLLRKEDEFAAGMGEDKLLVIGTQGRENGIKGEEFFDKDNYDEDDMLDTFLVEEGGWTREELGKLMDCIFPKEDPEYFKEIRKFFDGEMLDGDFEKYVLNSLKSNDIIPQEELERGIEAITKERVEKFVNFPLGYRVLIFA